MAHFTGLRSILKTAKPIPPTTYPFGTALQHRDTPDTGPGMNVLKSMVIGRASNEHPYRIKIIRLSGGMFTGEVNDVYVDSWEPVDARE